MKMNGNEYTKSGKTDGGSTDARWPSYAPGPSKRIDMAAIGQRKS